jgi:hypothetical protein
MTDSARPSVPGPASAAPGALICGPDAGLPRAFDVYERLGHDDPAGAWTSFNRAYNWAAPLLTATPAGAVGDDVPCARPWEGGWLLSGLWQLPRPLPRAQWVALPLSSAPNGLPTERRRLFVAGVGTLGRSATDGDAFLVRLRDLYVPAGLTASAAGTALQDDEAEFLWVVVTAMAMGAARRIAEGTAQPAVARFASPGPPAADLRVLLRRERRAMQRDLIVASAPGTGPSLKIRSLAERVQRTYHLVRDVYAAGYESAIPRNLGDGSHPLESLVTGSAPLLQHARFTTGLLPAAGTST